MGIARVTAAFVLVSAAASAAVARRRFTALLMICLPR
jgi:hypothetical protein